MAQFFCDCTGVSGVSGDKGLTGDAGPTGDKGATGATGVSGATGPQDVASSAFSGYTYDLITCPGGTPTFLYLDFLNYNIDGLYSVDNKVYNFRGKSVYLFFIGLKMTGGISTNQLEVYKNGTPYRIIARSTVPTIPRYFIPIMIEMDFADYVEFVVTSTLEVQVEFQRYIGCYIRRLE